MELHVHPLVPDKDTALSKIVSKYIVIVQNENNCIEFLYITHDVNRPKCFTHMRKFSHR